MANNKDVKTYDLELDVKQLDAWIKNLRDRQIISIEKGLTFNGEPAVNMTIYKNGTPATLKQVLQNIEYWAARLKEHAAAAQKQQTMI